MSFDPFSSADNAAFAISVPLFVVVIACRHARRRRRRGRDLGVAGAPPSRGAPAAAPRRTDWRAEAEALKAAQRLGPPCLAP